MTTSTTSPATDRSRGRAFLWAGVGACLLGLALVVVQFVLGYLRTPWYSPALATVGALLVLAGVVQRPGVFRIVVLFLVAGLAGFQWFAIGWSFRLPAYEGPIQVGDRFPEFTSTRADDDGTSFTDANLRDGRRRVLVFYRGKW